MHKKLWREWSVLPHLRFRFNFLFIHPLEYWSCNVSHTLEYYWKNSETLKSYHSRLLLCGDVMGILAVLFVFTFRQPHSTRRQRGSEEVAVVCCYIGWSLFALFLQRFFAFFSSLFSFFSVKLASSCSTAAAARAAAPSSTAPSAA